jgi:hypothetical protein
MGKDIAHLFPFLYIDPTIFSTSVLARLTAYVRCLTVRPEMDKMMSRAWIEIIYVVATCNLL